MKKQCLVLALSFLIIIYVGNHTLAEAVIKVGIDLPGKHQASLGGSSSTLDVNMGISLSGEHISSKHNNVEIGFGMTFQMPRSLEDSSGNFNFVPFYGLVKISSVSSETSPYIIGQLGYNLLYMGDSTYKGPFSLNGGIYYGIGVGIVLQDLSQLEILYSVNKGSVELTGYPGIDVEYSKITLSFGINFGK